MHKANQLFFFIKEKKEIIFFTILCIIYYFIVKMFQIYLPCMFHKITGFYCPGCGVTRMIIEILSGNFYQAFRYNALLFICSPIIFILIIDYIYSLIDNKKALYQKIPNYMWYIAIVIFIVFAIIRNIFPYFAPTVI